MVNGVVMIEDTIAEYSYLMLSEYRDLKDGSPNFHHNPALRISGKGKLTTFLEHISYNSKLYGVTIREIEIKVLNEPTQEELK